MRKSPPFGAAWHSPLLWDGMASTFENLRGGEPYSAKLWRYALKLVLTIMVLAGGWVLICLLSDSGELSFSKWGTVAGLLVIMRGKILVLFEPLYIRLARRDP